MAQYYPKSQIQTSLYTNGEEFVLASTNESYTGYYYVVGGEEFYTGKNPSDTPNELLLRAQVTPIGNDGTFDRGEIVVQDEDYEQYIVGNPENNLNYSNLPKSSLTQNRFLPQFFSPLPTSRDYELGEFQRYFCKKSNELIFLEISNQTYQSLLDRDPTIAFELYNPISIPWSLTGDKEQVYNINKRIVFLKEKQQNVYGFSSYFKDDFSKYCKSSPTSSSNINSTPTPSLTPSSNTGGSGY